MSDCTYISTTYCCPDVGKRISNDYDIDIFVINVQRTINNKLINFQITFRYIESTLAEITVSSGNNKKNQVETDCIASL